jgi:hypothetical protein
MIYLLLLYGVYSWVSYLSVSISALMCVTGSLMIFRNVGYTSMSFYISFFMYNVLIIYHATHYWYDILWVILHIVHIVFSLICIFGVYYVSHQQFDTHVESPMILHEKDIPISSTAYKDYGHLMGLFKHMGIMNENLVIHLLDKHKGDTIQVMIDIHKLCDKYTYIQPSKIETV